METPSRLTSPELCRVTDAQACITHALFEHLSSKILHNFDYNITKLIDGQAIVAITWRQVLEHETQFGIKEDNLHYWVEIRAGFALVHKHLSQDVRVRKVFEFSNPDFISKFIAECWIEKHGRLTK